MPKSELSAEQQRVLLNTLKVRFEKYLNRHKDVNWNDVQSKLKANNEKMWSLYEMEKTGGEPDVVGYDKDSDKFLFVDCSEQTPQERRSICYDHRALESRKEYKPLNSALNMASDMGIDLLTEQEYRELQQLGEFDTKTSSWVKTPPGIRDLGGALYCDRRYNQVFLYHNGADSYYAVRGFRGILKV